MMQIPPALQTFVVGWNDVPTMAKGVDVTRR